MKKFLVILLALTAACSLGKSPESAVYAIRPMATEEQGCKLPLDLQVAEPTSSPGLGCYCARNVANSAG